MRHRHLHLFLLTGLVLIMGIAACGTVEDPNGESASQTGDNSSGKNEAYDGEFFSEGFILTYFIGVDEAHITLDISKARAEYLMEVEEADGTDDMQYILQVEKAGELDIADTDDEAVAVEDIYEGDKVYVAYDMEDYIAGEKSVVETDQLIVEEVTPEEMVQRFAPSNEGDYYVGIVHREGIGWGYDEFDLEHLLDFDRVRSFGSILHQDDVPAYDYIEAFDIEGNLPIFFIISQHGLEYKTHELDEVEDFLEGTES